MYLNWYTVFFLVCLQKIRNMQAFIKPTFVENSCQVGARQLAKALLDSPHKSSLFWTCFEKKIIILLNNFTLWILSSRSH
jgi:hypothetical protein